MFSFRPVIVACRLNPPLVAMLAAPTAEKLTASVGKSPFTRAEVGASWAAWALSAEEYQVTIRCDSLEPTPRMMPVRVAESAAVAGAAPKAPAETVRPRASAAIRTETRLRANRVARVVLVEDTRRPFSKCGMTGDGTPCRRQVNP